MFLIVCEDDQPSRLWARYLERHGQDVVIHKSQDAAATFLSEHEPSAIVLDLMLTDGSALAVADYANYRWPNTPVIFVTKSRFFSDGSLFKHISNTAAVVPHPTAPKDLADIVAYHGARH